jgi:hypothetical protein
VWTALAFRQSATELNASGRFVDTSQAFGLAEAGLNDALQWLRAQPSPPTGTAAFDPFGGTQTLGPGTYSVTIDPDDTNPTTPVDHFTIRATGRDATTQAQRRLETVVRLESAARYSYASNLEYQLVSGERVPRWLTSHDRLDGPTHTNGQWNISGSPQFHGPTSSVATTINYAHGGPPGDNPRFHQGLTLGAAPVEWSFDTSELRVAAASSSGHWYTGNTTLALRSDGSVVVTNAALGWTNRVRPLPPNGAVFVNGGTATVSGTLQGQVTIGASEDLVIADHLDYQTNPTTRGAADLLGLVAEQDVVVAASAPSGLRIQGLILVPNGSFTVEDWWMPPPKGELHIYGGLIQDAAAPTGAFHTRTGNLVSGYGKDYKYDERLATMSPPFFPTTGRYEEVLWRELENN